MASRDTPLRRGQIWLVDWEPRRGSEQGGTRPSLVIQADEANELAQYGNTIVVTMSTAPAVDEIVHVAVEPSRLNGLDRPGMIRCEQIMTITKARLTRYIGQLEPRFMQKVDRALLNVLGPPAGPA